VISDDQVRGAGRLSVSDRFDTKSSLSYSSARFSFDAYSVLTRVKCTGIDFGTADYVM